MKKTTAGPTSWEISELALQQAMATVLDFGAPLKEQCDSFSDLAAAIMTELRPYSKPVVPPVKALKSHPKPVTDGIAAIMGLAILAAAILVVVLVTKGR